MCSDISNISIETYERDNTTEMIYEILVSGFLSEGVLSTNKALECSKDIENSIYNFSNNQISIYQYKRAEIMSLLLNNKEVFSMLLNNKNKWKWNRLFNGKI